MRFGDRKTVEQPSRAAVFRGRERLVHQRTADVNALRALLSEHGHVFPQGIRSRVRMTALVEDETADLPSLIRAVIDPGRVRQGAPTSDHAGCGTADGCCGGSFWP